MEIHRIATIHTSFGEKFGIPRQAGLVPGVTGEIRFEPEYRSADVLRGIEGFSHLWLIWGFSGIRRESGEPIRTVAPPRLGGKERVGVFASRSPYRPNGLGLSSVRFEQVRTAKSGEPLLIVSGVDLMDGTPIYDIKPYLPYTDAHPGARAGFADAREWKRIAVDFPEELRARLPEDMRENVTRLLEQDPRAAYHKKPGTVFGMRFSDYDIRFAVSRTQEGQERLTVCEVVRSDEKEYHNKKNKLS